MHIRLKYLANVVKGVHPLSAMLTSDYFKAETLLEMMNNGAMVEAQSFAVSGQAEDLLRDKITNPFAAAVGGYYLLKSRDLERMYDWANNLANRFPAFSDGAIIHAWQMIQEVTVLILNSCFDLNEEINEKVSKSKGTIEVIRSEMIKLAKVKNSAALVYY